MSQFSPAKFSPIELAQKMFEVQRQYHDKVQNCDIGTWDEMDVDDQCGLIAVAQWLVDTFGIGKASQ